MVDPRSKAPATCPELCAANPAKACALDPTTQSELENAIGHLKVEISLSIVPAWDLDDTEDHQPIKLNLFDAPDVADLQTDDVASNYLRDTARSTLAQSRIVALRRRKMRALTGRHAPVWPPTGGCSWQQLREMREWIYTPDPEALAAEARPSTPLRLATHAISLSLVATALPVGAALMTYNILKGEDIRVTARMTTLCGLALIVLAGNPQLAHLIGA